MGYEPLYHSTKPLKRNFTSFISVYALERES